MALKNGVNGKLYYLSTGTRATWNVTVTDGAHVGAAPSNLAEVALARDINYSQEGEKADVTTRLSRYKATKKTLIGISLDIPMVYDPANAALLALQKAFLTDASIALAVLDGDKATAGTMGVWADFEVVAMKKDEALADAQMVTFTVEPAYSAVAPEYVKVA